MTKEEQVALDSWREDEAWRIVQKGIWKNSIEQQHIEYRRLVRDDMRPPVVVDRAKDVWLKSCAGHTIDQSIEPIRTYGDERFAEGKAEAAKDLNFHYRDGINKALSWASEHIGSASLYADMRRDLLGETK